MSREGFVYPPTSSYGPASAREPAWQPPMNPPAAVAAAGSLWHSLARLELESHNTCIKKVQLDQDDNQTGSSYDRHVKNYTMYWAMFQAKRCQRAPGEVPVPAFPVTALKASFFLEYEMTREKHRQGKNETITGSNVGKSHISQVINTLESWRRNNAYLYKDAPDAQMSLRTDIRIRTAELSAKHQEPKHIEKAQALKAVGSSGDTYTPDELKRCSIWCLTDVSGVKSIWIGLHDRAMLLLSSTMAFRGESSRILEWSDLFLLSILMDDVRLGYRVPMSEEDNAKHNQQGRLDEHGAIRHREVELCPVRALAFLFFGFFHVLHLPLPNLLPDFEDNACAAMSYDNHCDRLRGIHEENNISITKVTHAGRAYAAQTVCAHGATVSGTKVLGGWNKNGSFHQCYEWTFPVDALLGAAMFNGHKPEMYSLPRDALKPPSELLAQVFPWIEQEQAALETRIQDNPLAQDYALRHFLRLMLWLRRVLLQDAMILCAMQPSAPVFAFAPFNTPAFHTFASQAMPAIQEAEEQARMAYQNLPEHLIRSLCGATTDVLMEQKRQHEESNRQMSDISERILKMEGMIGTLLNSRSTRRSKITFVPPKQSPAAPVTAPAPMPAAAAPPVITINFHGSDGPVSTSAVPSVSTSVSAIANGAASSDSTATLDGSSHHVAAVPALPSVSGMVAPSVAPARADPHLARRDELRQKYGEVVFQKHEPWVWKQGELLPCYRYQPVNAIVDVWTEWTEWTDRLSGHISVRELTEKWGNCWHLNDARLKTEGGRCKKIIDLITELSQKPRWSIQWCFGSSMRSMATTGRARSPTTSPSMGVRVTVRCSKLQHTICSAT
ncbi:hypothetical protein SCP_0301340 [Sparassis crispa]|uniref:Ndc10 domain-containing protein n=1 Tax=Sparassis crispa TaxID=139825 RepID=A0A401GE17_9APHY|nr:hypothetical protein SCP_0301340 [Sparassis crispa]GBE80419.1 hypothetical protein SCP_0301340 [Sparassis crispa]